MVCHKDEVYHYQFLQYLRLLWFFYKLICTGFTGVRPERLA